MSEGKRSDGPTGRSRRPLSPSQKPALTLEMHKRIGLPLRNLYTSVVQEGVPDRFTELLRRLDAQR
jgi:hypothetical protein